ncbi:MAG: hypothetical protein KGJ23_02840 [Euryarchaeota archaeon]|nr:hypothetical protein [Euryarchaeota archaeon]MDE1835535.1 hypothetical protein [Euryarchaeota archaeon]
MPILLKDLSSLPSGTHAIAFHDSGEEEAEHAVAFLRGASDPGATAYWVAEPWVADLVREKLPRISARFEGAIRDLQGPQVAATQRVLRPVPEIAEFVSAHPRGVSAGADAVSYYWTREDVPRIEEYESWFDQQPRGGSRFLCPYDLRRIPLDMAPSLMRQLGSAHDHLTLSDSEDPISRLVQAFLFASPQGVPEGLRGTVDEALDNGWLYYRPSHGFSWTVRGEHFSQLLRERTRTVPLRDPSPKAPSRSAAQGPVAL